MKITKIFYKKLDEEKILFVRAENVATIEQIQNEFGWPISEEYKTGAPCYAQDEEGDINICLSLGPAEELNSRSMWLIKDHIYTKEEFQQRIATMKAAGLRFTRIKEKFQGAEERMVEI